MPGYFQPTWDCLKPTKSKTSMILPKAPPRSLNAAGAGSRAAATLWQGLTSALSQHRHREPLAARRISQKFLAFFHDRGSSPTSSKTPHPTSDFDFPGLNKEFSPGCEKKFFPQHGSRRAWLSLAASPRCNRQLGRRFADDVYAAEGLIAELGSAFLCAHRRIDGQLQHASYVDHWLKVLRADKRAIFVAATKAQQAADYVLNLANPTPALARAG